MSAFFKFFSLGTIFLLLIGFVYQSYTSYVDSSSFEKTGEMFDVGGYSLYVEDYGTGKVNVIFDSGMGDDLSVWNQVADEVSKFSRVITYDRAGLGWSEKSSKERDSNAIVEELHSIVEQKNLTGPIVLVGHSFGGVNMQVYALTYPDDIAALVLVDSAHEDQIKKIPRTGSFQKYVFKLGMLAAPFGLPRLYLSNTSSEERAKKSTTKHQYTSLDEANYFLQSLKQLDALDPNYGDLPLVVIARNLPSHEIQKKNTKNYIWADLQESLASRSSDSTLIFTGERQHSIHKVQPDIVIEAIQMLVNRL